MTNNNMHSIVDTINNTARSVNGIKLRMHNGVMTGNIVDTPITQPVVSECLEGSLDFTCANNSQYVSIL